jgi:hypothetical protein
VPTLVARASLMVKISLWTEIVISQLARPFKVKRPVFCSTKRQRVPWKRGQMSA